MRTNTDADVIRAGDGDANGATGDLRNVVALCEGHIEIVATFFQQKTRWLGFRCLNFVGRTAGRFAKLERSETVAVESDIGVSGVGVERLTDHQDRFAVAILAYAKERDVGADGGVAGNFLPGEVKIVAGEPEITATTRDGVSPGAWIKLNLAGKAFANFLAALKDGSRLIGSAGPKKS